MKLLLLLYVLQTMLLMLQCDVPVGGEVKRRTARDASFRLDAGVGGHVRGGRIHVQLIDLSHLRKTVAADAAGGGGMMLKLRVILMLLLEQLLLRLLLLLPL